MTGNAYGRRGRRPGCVGRFIWYWMPLLLCLGVVVRLALWPKVGVLVPRFPLAEPVTHAAEYALLGLLMIRALSAAGVASAAPVSVVLCSLLGVADEFYQRVVPERTTELQDWLGNLVGVLLAAIIWKLWRAATRRREPPTHYPPLWKGGGGQR